VRYRRWSRSNRSILTRSTPPAPRFSLTRSQARAKCADHKPVRSASAPSAPAHLSLLPGSPATRLGYPRPTPPRSLPQQPSVRRRLLTRHTLRSRHSHRDPFPRSAPFESPPAAAPTRRSQGFYCSLVQQYHGSLRLLARRCLRFHLAAYTPSYSTPSSGTVRDLPG
jgi:hypothetical protein